MNAIQFIKEHSVEKAMEAITDHPRYANFVWIYNERITYGVSGFSGATNLTDLKRLVESVDLVTAWGGLTSSFSKLKYAEDHRNIYAANMIQQAIADYEQLFGNTETLELETLRDCDTSPNCKKFDERVK